MFHKRQEHFLFAFCIQTHLQQLCLVKWYKSSPFHPPTPTMHTLVHYADGPHRQQVIQLWETVFGYEAAHNTPSLAIDKKLAMHDGLFFVALVDGTVVGTVLATPPSPSYAKRLPHIWSAASLPMALPALAAATVGTTTL